MQTTHPRSSLTPPAMAYSLPVRHGWVALPQPTREFGGLAPVPYGYRADVYIGAARDIDAYTAQQLASALVNCAFYSVRGTDPQGLAAVGDALSALIGDVAAGRTV
ncbi:MULTISPECIES: hypothetical protein [Streptomyces]|uniref:hypothetical protein n=2 Tax=Streptomyces TaxID=1883 RepID=UPI000699DDFC|nr:hypothetical protein [Streptomyces kasugaensis]MYU57422.1 hypothetical protein [Streptomyces sp. SID7805]